MSDPGYHILSARYANPEHTAVIAQTAEAGAVAASIADRPALWHRIHSCGVAIEDYKAPQVEVSRDAGRSWAAADLAKTLQEPDIPVQVLPDGSTRAIPPAAVPAPPPVLTLGEGERRRLARGRVTAAVADANRVTDGEHYRYELALMVVNENVEAMNDMKAVAAASGLPVKEYAKRTIASHNARRRRAAQIYAIEAQALKEIDAATGDAIEAVAERAVRDIGGEE
jgi:hypothetical protein